jgi:hypothetical protein
MVRGSETSRWGFSSVLSGIACGNRDRYRLAVQAPFVHYQLDDIGYPPSPFEIGVANAGCDIATALFGGAVSTGHRYVAAD